MDIIIKTEIENLLTYHSIEDIKTNKDELDRKIVSIANFFGIFYLPEYLKIKIYIDIITDSMQLKIKKPENLGRAIIFITEKKKLYRSIGSILITKPFGNTMSI